MSFSVIPSDKFKKEAKRLSKKFPSLRQDLAELNEILTSKPETGTSLGNDTYKIRLAVKQGQRKKWWSKANYLCCKRQQRSLLTDDL